MRIMDQLSNFKDEKKKYVFILDGETDGLYGTVFALSAIVVDLKTCDILDGISLYAPNIPLTSKFVIENIVPVLGEPPMQIKNEYVEKDLIEDLWTFYEKYRDESIVIADFGAPVEARMFYLAVLNNIADREFKAPYPMHELGTILLLNGMDPDLNRDAYYEDPSLKHHPYYDCISTLNILNEKIL